ncbi:NFACT family protein [Clostridioides mangenotii]|uniref:Rqc2 family fibronectin-binding protein n=1 Tax=Metaclostridioides mangenotii TaxID=1540 RepID=UPI001C11BCD4|nr:NFACT RNA binding domain-containing protein [Clostridioides mangenotii]MBU5306690.1 NFACT family protein [Clostridioides mangenotii]
MALDGLVIHSIVDELSSKLVGGKVDKISQPENDEIILNIRNNPNNYKLVLSASASNPRVYIANNYKKQNPKKAPVFCMLFRKHIQGGTITKVSQIGFERIIKISVESLDELKEKSTKDIIVEIMGRHSNIILVQSENSKIFDSAKRVPVSVSRVRQILPGLTYELPPAQDKINPLDKLSSEVFIENIKTYDGPVFKGIYTKFLGISPIIAKEICFRSSVDPKINTFDLTDEDISRLYIEFEKLFKDISKNNFHPSIIVDRSIDKYLDFSCVNLTIYKDLDSIYNESVSEILENYYQTRDVKDRIHQRASDLRKSITIKLDRLYNKQKKQHEELLESEHADEFKLKGELLTAYIYMIKKGMKEIEVQNFYTSDYSNIKISLNENLTPSENSQKYFKKYNKLKTAKKEITHQMDINEEEIDYLENILLSIDNCENMDELQDIREELVKLGYAKVQGKAKPKKETTLTTMPHKFLSSDGTTIFVGKNNKQNDHLTLRIADYDDIWLHTKNIPGSHVIIKCAGTEVSDETIYEGAMLAAYFSKSKMSSKVPVDYTKKKNVKKPSGSKPGMVIYETNSTIYVTPTEEMVAKLKPKDD